MMMMMMMMMSAIKFRFCMNTLSPVTSLHGADPPNFSLLQNFLGRKGCPKIPNLGLKIPLLGKFRVKIKFQSTHKIFCRKIAATVCSAYISLTVT